MLKKILNIDKKWIPLAIIILIGIFLRTYRFHNLLRFNPDQVRDTTIINNIFQGNFFNILGPKAGGTEFHLGPFFYYIHALSAFLFGSYPDKIAYLSVFFSILAIPLFYYFLTHFFNRKISLFLTALYSISFFAIKYSRFSWNPNDLPFFTIVLLITLLKILNNGKEEKIIWSVIAGLALGIGMQLHTLFLIIYPLLTLTVFVFLAYKKIFLKKSILCIFLILIFLNLPQIIYEYNSGGKNISQFAQGIGEKTKKDGSLVKSVSLSTQCYIQGNFYTLTSLEGDRDCKIFKLGRKDIASHLIQLISATLLSLGGILLMFFYFRREKDLHKRNFLLLVIFGITASFLIFIPLANEINIRLFIVIYFFFYVLLGLWIQFISRCFLPKTFFILAVFGLVLFGTNLYADYINFINPEKYYDRNNSSGTITLGETESISKYLAENYKTGTEKGKKAYLESFDYIRPLNYISTLNGQEYMEVTSHEEDKDPGSIIYFISSTEDKQAFINKKAENFNFLHYETFGSYTVYALEKK